MSLRVRLGIAAGAAVVIAVVAVAAAAYAGTRSELTGQLDATLQNLARGALHDGGPGGPGPPGGGGLQGQDGGAGGGLGSANTISEPLCFRDEGLGLDRRLVPSFGGAPGDVLLVTSCGTTFSPHGQAYKLPADDDMKALARSGTGSYFTDETVNGTHLRVYVSGIGRLGALAVALPLTSVDSALRHELLLIALVAAAGVALAALLGILVARTALAPIARFTRATESIAVTGDQLEQRLEVRGRDELARLATTFNATLDALDASVQAQRNLVADASHELRTPIASVRANLQLMRDESRLSESDREALREDMIAELDELTGLVGDVVELARGSKPSGELGDVRLDEVVSAVIARTRRRAPELTIHEDLERTLVRGDGSRIERAVANLLDNARKWSPTDGSVEVSLRDGLISVRDHGPGFNEQDLPFVFDRFHRARDARSKPGSGLGLAIVRQAAEAHGGFARAENAVDGGAIVAIAFGRPQVIESVPVPTGEGAA